MELDRLFLELHDQLPREAREKFAKLADEVKKLTQTSTAELPSADQVVVRRVEGTIEAKQSSADLPARGEVMHVVGCFVDCSIYPLGFQIS